MASGAPRDLTFRFLSDTDRFDLTDPAHQLDELGATAQDTGRQLDDLATADPRLDRVGDEARDTDRRLDDLADQAKSTGKRLDDLGDQAKAGGGKLDDLGDQAKSTASRVDDAFDAIARSSRSNLDKTREQLDKTSDGLDEFKDEASQSGREAAASFSGGFDDITDLVQETAANAFAGFGPVGAAAGIAAAAGIGFLVNAAQEAKERIKELAAGLLELRLDPSMDTAGGRIKQVLDQFKDDGNLTRFRDAAEQAGVKWADFVLAMTGDRAALDRVNAQIDATTGRYSALQDVLLTSGRAGTDLENALIDQGVALDDADRAASAYTDPTLSQLITRQDEAAQAAEDHAAAVSSLGDAIDGFADPATTYSELLATKQENERASAQATADATSSQSDSWADYARDVDISVSEYLTALAKQVTAQEDWADNLDTLARRGVQDGVLEQLAKLGPEGAPLVAKLTTASDAELAKLVDLYTRQGKAAGDRVAGGILDARPKVSSAASELRSEVRDRLAGRPITIPTNISPPAYAAASTVRSTIANMIGTVKVPVMLQNVPQSIWASPRYMP